MITVKKYSRKSKRQKNDNEYATSNNGNESDTKWTDKNKKLLLEALKTYGSENIKDVSKMIPTIPVMDITSKILEYSKISESVCKNEFLDKWLKCGSYKLGDSMIPEALLFIQLFENHPSSIKLGGYDISEIYKFLYCSCYEQISYFDLSSKDRSLLYFLLSKVERKFLQRSETEVVKYVTKVYNKRKIKRVYPGKNGHFY